MDSQHADSDSARTEHLSTDEQHQVWRSLWTYCTSLFGDEGDPPTYCGSGTFVTVRGAPCLLTAAHVWKQLSKHEGIGFVLEAEHPPAWVPVAALQERFVSDRQSEEWGPDIAVLSFHERDVRRLETEKAFYRLDRDRAASGDPHGIELWAVVGASAELSQFTKTEAWLKNHMLAATAPRRVTHEGLDYIEVPYGNTPEVDIPLFWGGLSGAGLWRCDLSARSPAGAIAVAPFLSGVAFYQAGVGPRRGAIRCHGPRSLFSHGFDHVA